KGKKEFVILPYEEYTLLHEYLEQVEDLLELRKVKEKEKKKKSISLDRVKSELNL
ncbi:MAG TPA: type II toxin-antitoxin system Phd/YefM family antitoxin, partial [Spirochaetota bacterium]|nr:type II toxin-antitoxin system Phd/YefM family antitoxin [Spirochaetota bacterium]